MPSLENPMTGNATVDWNIELVGAPEVWAEGVDRDRRCGLAGRIPVTIGSIRR